jgi:hypothetical protein
MNRRSKHKLVLAAWLALFFLMGFNVWNFQAGELMLILFMIASFLAYALYAFFVRCGKCRMPLLLKPARIMGIDLYLWSLITPDRCRHCGEPIL